MNNIIYVYILYYITLTEGEAFTGDADTTMAHLKTAHSARAYLCNCGHVVRKRADYVKHIGGYWVRIIKEKINK